MNVLIYNPANHPAKDLESLMDAFVKKGNSVFLLTLDEKGKLHENSRKLGVQTFSVNPSETNGLFSQVKFLVNFCKRNKIDVVYSNLQQCSKHAIIAQYFTKAKFIIYRHHSDSVYLYGSQKEKILDRLINKLSKRIIVISELSRQQIIDVEKTNPKKVFVIPLGYNFDFLPKPDLASVAVIKEKFNASLLIIIVGRLIPLKRNEIAINAISDLIERGLDIKLLILGSGSEEQKLSNIIIKRNTGSDIFMLGHKTNVEDYIAASDLLIHVSNSEASCHMPKEAGILGKPVIVCENVGDFSDYIIHGENGMLIDKVNTEVELRNEIENLYNNKSLLFKLGTSLKDTVTDKFDIGRVFELHEQLIMSLDEK